MQIFDWLLSGMGLITSKALEALTSESIKKWLNEGKTDVVRKELVNLYKQLSNLEQVSQAFVDLLDKFVKQENRRLQNAAIWVGDSRWYVQWAQTLASKANEVAKQMDDVNKVIQRLNPHAEIFMPELTEFLGKYEKYVRAEIVIPNTVIDRIELMNMNYSEVGFYGAVLSINPYNKELSVPFGELPPVIIKIKEAVDMLPKAKRQLADFIRTEYKFSEL